MRNIVSSLTLGLVIVMCLAGCGGEDQLRGRGPHVDADAQQLAPITCHAVPSPRSPWAG